MMLTSSMNTIYNVRFIGFITLMPIGVMFYY